MEKQLLGIGPDFRENWEEISAIINIALRTSADALIIFTGADIIADLLTKERYSHLWEGCLNPFADLLNELLFTATDGKEGSPGIASKSLETDAPRWQFALARNFFRQVKNPVPNNIRDFLRQAKKITASLLETHSVQIADKEIYETIIAFLKVSKVQR